MKKFDEANMITDLHEVERKIGNLLQPDDSLKFHKLIQQVSETLESKIELEKEVYGLRTTVHNFEVKAQRNYEYRMRGAKK